MIKPGQRYLGTKEICGETYYVSIIEAIDGQSRVEDCQCKCIKQLHSSTAWNLNQIRRTDLTKNHWILLKNQDIPQEQ